MRLQVEPKRRPRASKSSPRCAQAWPSATQKRACKLEVEPKSFEVAKTSKSSSRAGESSTLRVASAPEINLGGAKLQFKCDLDGQVAPKRRRVALGVRLGTPKCDPRGSNLRSECDLELPSATEGAQSCTWIAIGRAHFDALTQNSHLDSFHYFENPKPRPEIFG